MSDSSPHPLAGRLPPNKGTSYPAEILTPGEFRRILAQIPTHTWLGRRNRALINVLYRAGLRISEALALRPHHIDLDAGVIQILHGKGDKRRTVGIDVGACAVVAEWLAVGNRRGIPPGAPLFPSGNGRPLSQSYLRIVLPKLAAEAGGDTRVHPHGLRHTLEGVEMPHRNSLVSAFGRWLSLRPRRERSESSCASSATPASPPPTAISTPSRHAR